MLIFQQTHPFLTAFIEKTYISAIVKLLWKNLVRSGMKWDYV